MKNLLFLVIFLVLPNFAAEHTLKNIVKIYGLYPSISYEKFLRDYDCSKLGYVIGKQFLSGIVEYTATLPNKTARDKNNKCIPATLRYVEDHNEMCILCAVVTSGVRLKSHVCLPPSTVNINLSSASFIKDMIKEVELKEALARMKINLRNKS